MARTCKILSALVLVACNVEPANSDFGGPQDSDFNDPAGSDGTTQDDASGGSPTNAGTDGATGDTEDTDEGGTDDGSSAPTDDGGFECGDGMVEGDEACDGTDLAGQDCTSFGFDLGDVVCTASCTVDTSGCSNEGDPICGNGSLEDDEPCDGTLLGGQDCTDFGFEHGELTCSPTCNVQATACGSCGDGTQNGPEACDGQSLGGHSCESQGLGPGTLGCLADCTAYDTSQCGPAPVCGDGTQNGSEECDTDDLGGTTCESLPGFDAGTLACSASCTYDTSDCHACAGFNDPCSTDADCCAGFTCDDFFGSTCWP